MNKQKRLLIGILQMKARELLEEYLRISSIISSKVSQIKRLEKLITIVSGHCSVDCLSNVRIDLENDVTRFAEIQNTISELLDQLENPTHISVLSGKYIDGMSMSELSRSMGYSERNLWRIHDQAIENMQVVMDCQLKKGGELPYYENMEKEMG